MKIFDSGSKVNFVDDNNVFIGYDLSLNCCEYADWFISKKKETDINGNYQTPDGLEGYNFDINYFEYSDDAQGLCSGDMVIFRLINKDKELFLHLFNAHNGYYGHGFKAEINGIKWQEGYL